MIATMLRLSLNVATTRLILSNGADGYDAQARDRGLCQLRDGGDFVIGTVVFIILITVNFLVITKGATVSQKWAPASPWMPSPASRWPSMPTFRRATSTRRRPCGAGASSKRKAPSSAPWTVRRSSSAAMRRGLIITAVNVFGGIIIGVTRS